MRELAWNHIVAFIRTDFGRIVREAVQVLIIVGHSQCISFSSEVPPVECHVGIGKDIRQVGHTFFVGNVLRTAGYGSLHIIAHVHLREITADTHPFAEAVTGGYVISLRQHLSVVYISGCRLAATQVGYVALDIILGIAINQPSLHIYGMSAESPVIA